MLHRILGLHHVTATVEEAQPDLDFCLNLLGFRLVKKTVNFDNHHVYHFYYGNETGTPGTVWTTFPYAGRGVRVGVKGAGQVVATSFSVPADSLDTWRRRLAARALVVEETSRLGNEVLQFTDPSGLQLELIGTTTDPRRPWSGNGIDTDSAIRGLHSVSMVVKSLGPTLTMMVDLLGYVVVGQEGARTRVAAGGDAPGHLIDIIEDSHADDAVNGLGTVHHVAMAIGSAEEQGRLRESLLQMGRTVTEVRDRCYFQSIYFREPGGVLFEVATTTPGFTVDEDRLSLGRNLMLPPWEEPNRADIEAHLVPIRHL